MIVWILLAIILFLLTVLVIFILISKYFRVCERNTTYYPKNTEFQRKITLKKIDFKQPGKIYNPSILRVGNDILVLSRITIPTLKFGIESKKLNFYDNTCITCKIKDFNWDRIHEESEPFAIAGVPGCRSQGIEDPRIFMFKKELYFSCALRNPECGVDTYIGKLNKNFNELEYIYQVECTFDNAKEQKNWNFFMEKDGEMYFSQCLEPHTIVRIDSDGSAYKVYETSSECVRKRYPKKFHLRGGSRVVKISDDFLIGIGHVCKGKLYKTYSHLFYIVKNTEPYEIIKLSEEFCFPDDIKFGCSHIQFCSGLEYIYELNELWISFGTRDKYSYLAKVSLDDVLKFMS